MNYFDTELEHAQDLIGQNKLNEAVKAYKDLLDQVTEDDEILLHLITKDLGFLYYEMEEYQAAIDCLLTALNQNFDDEDGRTNKILGFSYSKLGQNEFAIEYLEEAGYLNTEENDELFITKFELGKCYIETEEYTLAVAQLRLSFDYFKEDLTHEYYGSSTYYLGFAYFLAEDLELATEYFDLLTSNEALRTEHIAHGYYGKLFIAKAKRIAEDMITYAGKLMELIPDFYDRETIMFFTVLAYQYQNRQQEYDTALGFFITEYPNGKYSDQYDELKEYEFKIIEI